MEKKVSDILKDSTLIDNDILWYLCLNCGYFDKFGTDRICPDCRNINYHVDTIYPHFAAIDMAYSLILLKELSGEVQRELITAAVKSIKDLLGKDVSYDDCDFILKKVSGMRNNKENFDFFKFDILVEKRLSLTSKKEVDSVAFELCSGKYINRLYKPFIVLCASFIELLFKDYASNIFVRRLGVDAGNKVLELYENKSIKELDEFISILLNFSIKDRSNAIEKTFYDKWVTLRKERNEIIHNNEIFVYSERITDVFNIVKSAVKVFGNLRSQCIKNN